MSFQSIEQILKECKETNQNFYEVVQASDMKERMVTKEQSFETMTEIYHSMVNADASYDEKLRSNSGLVGGDGAKIDKALKENRLLSGPLVGEIMSTAIKMAESNACMKRIVAAPTAGSCGVVPAVFLTLQKHLHIPEQKMIEALYVVAGIGEVIATRAFVSGAEGGCQAEIGAASSMAAAGIAYLSGGDCDTIAHAASIALKNLLGLACDPVAGLVEVPCVKRNVIGAVNALTSADLALCGLTSAIPTDEVIDAMRSIGLSMPSSIRETGEGGLAGTPTGKRLMEKLERY